MSPYGGTRVEHKFLWKNIHAVSNKIKFECSEINLWRKGAILAYTFDCYHIQRSANAVRSVRVCDISKLSPYSSLDINANLNVIMTFNMPDVSTGIFFQHAQCRHNRVTTQTSSSPEYISTKRQYIK